MICSKTWLNLQHSSTLELSLKQVCNNIYRIYKNIDMFAETIIKLMVSLLPLYSTGTADRSGVCWRERNRTISHLSDRWMNKLFIEILLITLMLEPSENKTAKEKCLITTHPIGRSFSFYIAAADRYYDSTRFDWIQDSRLSNTSRAWKTSYDRIGTYKRVSSIY